MLKNSLFASAVALATLVPFSPANAQQTPFDADATCTSVLSGETDIAALWAFGYLSRMQESNLPVTEETLTKMVIDLSSACDAASDTIFSQLVAQTFGDEEMVSTPAAPSAPAVMPTSAPTDEDPQALLDFLGTQGANFSKLLVMLKPTQSDIETVFPPEMAAKLVPFYDEMFGERLASEEFPAPHIVESSSFTTTTQLRNHEMLDEISNGFKRVLDQFQIDAPFGTVRISFPAEGDSMKLHGMMYVNGHWVLMLRPWKGLSE